MTPTFPTGNHVVMPHATQNLYYNIPSPEYSLLTAISSCVTHPKGSRMEIFNLWMSTWPKDMMVAPWLQIGFYGVSIGYCWNYLFEILARVSLTFVC